MSEDLIRGEKLVCVDVSGVEGGLHPKEIILGEIYTFDSYGTAEHIYVAGNPTGWLKKRFRKVDPLVESIIKIQNESNSSDS
jgi:hypothetical protein